MIPLPFGIRPVGLPENRCDIHCVQITHGRPVHLLYRNARNLAALRDRQWFAMCDKGEEAVDGSQTTVAGADGYFLSFSRCCKNANTSAASRSDSDSAVISRRLRSETKRSNSFHVSRYDITVGRDRFLCCPIHSWKNACSSFAREYGFIATLRFSAVLPRRSFENVRSPRAAALV